MKRFLIVWVLTITAWSVALGQASDLNANRKTSPLAGTWKADLAKSVRDPNHQFQSLTLRFEVSTETVSLTYNGVNMSGEEESATTILHPDGKEHILAEAPGVVVTTKWLDSHILETVATKLGKVVGQGRYEVSSDGKTLMARIKGIDAGEKSFEQLIVLER